MVTRSLALFRNKGTARAQDKYLPLRRKRQCTAKKMPVSLSATSRKQGETKSFALDHAFFDEEKQQ